LDDRPVTDVGEDFVNERQDNFIRPRAYPNDTINGAVRVQAYNQLVDMRRRLQMPHINTGWFDTPGPGDHGPGGSAWSSIGPTNINGRITSIAIDPNDHNHLFVTSVGGIWRSLDGGRRWRRVSDEFLASVFASVAIDPGVGSNEIIAGGGEPNFVPASPGSEIGIWRSTLGGDPTSWSKVSPPELDNQIIFKLIYDPAGTHNVYAATSAGVYLGTHVGAGMTWSRLGGFDAGTSDLAVDFAASPRKVYAGVYSASFTYARGIWKYDGTSWNKRDTGIPTSSGRTIALALAPSSTSILYAKVENGSNGLLLGVYKTTTAAEPSGGGNAWTNLPAASVMDDSHFSATRGYSWYNSVLGVDPNDANTVWGGGLNIYRSRDGGRSWTSVSGGADPSIPVVVHADHHAVAFDPTNTKIVFVADDGGIFRSTDTSSATWHWSDVSHGMIITQFYHITSQQASAFLIAGGSQDNGTEISFGNRTWYQTGGCDGSDVAVDGGNSDTLYANCNGGLYEVSNPVPGTVGGGTSVPNNFPAGISWSPPIVADPLLQGRALAVGVDTAVPHIQHLLKTTDGVNWSLASPPLPAGKQISFIAIAPSSSFRTYYVGVAGGGAPTIWRTTVGGGTSTANWSMTTSGLPATLWPNAAAVDWTDPRRAVVVSGGAAGGGIVLTRDGGATWDALPGSGANAFPPSAAATSVAFDPNPGNPNTVYVAANIGIFRGQITPGSPPTAAWFPFDEGLPDGIDVTDVWANRTTKTLYIGTYGHGAYQRDVTTGATYPAVTLLVRDNVLDTGHTPSVSPLPDPEHPIPDPARPGFFKPNDTDAGQLWWYQSTDIRIDVPSVDPPANQIANADHVEFETAPIDIATAPPGVMKDSSPIRGQFAKAYVQVYNRGLQPASNVRVIALFADATSGLPLLPTTFWSTTFPAGGGPCGALDTSTGWNFVDSATPCRTIPVVNPELPEVIGFNWNVPLTAGDHMCLLVIVESADDPIASSVRTLNQRDLAVIVPNNRQIANRNLHVVDSGLPHMAPAGMEGMQIPNNNRDFNSVQVSISQADLYRGSELSLLFPPNVQFSFQGMQRVPANLTPQQRQKALQLGVDPNFRYQVTAQQALIPNLPVPPGTKMTIAVLFDAGPLAQPDAASRFSIITRQGQTMLGGSTYILREPAAVNHLLFTAPTNATAGTAITGTVTAVNRFNQRITNYLGTVHFTSTDPQAVLPADYQFTAADAGVHAFSFLLKTAGTQTIYATDTATNTITDCETVIVSPAAPSTLMVSGFPSPTLAGLPGTFTVVAKDPYGNTTPSYRGTVHFTSSDPQAVLPGNYSFTAADGGVHVFTATLKTAGTQSLTATDGTLSGTQSGIVVDVALPVRLGVSAPARVTAGAAFNITVTALDAFGNTVTSYTGTVHFTSNDPQATLPADATLTNGVGTFSVTLATAGSQTVTATDTANNTITGSATVNVVPAVLDHFRVTTSVDGGSTVAGTPFDVTVTAQDVYGNTVTGYQGTVTFTSADPYGATLPSPYTFQASDQGMATFAGATALYTAGTGDVTVTDTGSGITGSAFVNVQAAPAVAFQVIAPASAVSGTPFDVTLVAVDPYGNTDTNYQGTVTWTTTDPDPGVQLPADYTFQPNDAGIVTFPGGVTLITPGDQFITATDTLSGITGSADVTVTPGPGPYRGKPGNGTLGGVAPEQATAPCPPSGFSTPPVLGTASARSAGVESEGLNRVPGFKPRGDRPAAVLRSNPVDQADLSVWDEVFTRLDWT
jgi:hypothetical protein